MTPTFSHGIPALNDEFRQTGPLFGRTKFDGLWLVSCGVQAEGPQFTWRALAATQVFDGFDQHNDPRGEHDFGAFEIDGRRVFWQIDYLQRGTPFPATDPSDNAATCRVIIITLVEEC
jgi:hypothetical protein